MPPRRPARDLRHRALGVVVGDGGDAVATTGQVIDQSGGCPGAVRGVGVQVEIDGVRWAQRQWSRRRGGGRNLVGGSAGRVCQGGPPETRRSARRLMLPGSLADVSRPDSRVKLVQCAERVPGKVVA